MGGGAGRSSSLLMSVLMFRPLTLNSTPSKSTSTDTSWFSRGHLQFAQTLLLKEKEMRQRKAGKIKRYPRLGVKIPRVCMVSFPEWDAITSIYGFLSSLSVPFIHHSPVAHRVNNFVQWINPCEMKL